MRDRSNRWAYRQWLLGWLLGGIASGFPIGCAWAQSPEKPIFQLQNPSFEGMPYDGAEVEHWESCEYNSTPDLLPGPWGVRTPARDGNTYLGLITREDNTWEAIYQRLATPLRKNTCYKVHLDLARSLAYSGYNRPTRLRVWGCSKPCQRTQLLFSSPTIEHPEWRTYEFSFTAQQDYDYLIIECFYKEPTLLPYRGNILVDFIRPFQPCDRA